MYFNNETANQCSEFESLSTTLLSCLLISSDHTHERVEALTCRRKGGVTPHERSSRNRCSEMKRESQKRWPTILKLKTVSMPGTAVNSASLQSTWGCHASQATVSLLEVDMLHKPQSLYLRLPCFTGHSTSIKKSNQSQLKAAFRYC